MYIQSDIKTFQTKEMFEANVETESLHIALYISGASSNAKNVPVLFRSLLYCLPSTQPSRFRFRNVFQDMEIIETGEVDITGVLRIVHIISILLHRAFLNILVNKAARKRG